MLFSGSHLFSSEIISNDFLVDNFKLAIGEFLAGQGGLPKEVLWKGVREIGINKR